MRKIFGMIMFALVINCSPKLVTKNNKPALKKAHTPGIFFQVNEISKMLKKAELNTISIDNNIRSASDYSEKEKEEMMEALLNGTDFEKERVKDKGKLLSESERQNLVKDLESFKQANLPMLKDHDYETKYCNENIVMTKWTKKVGSKHELHELRKYNLSRIKDGIVYSQNYTVLIKKGNPKKLEIISANPDEDLFIKIDTKEIKIVREFYHLQVGFDWKFNEQMKRSFFESIEKCE